MASPIAERAAVERLRSRLDSVQGHERVNVLCQLAHSLQATDTRQALELAEDACRTAAATTEGSRHDARNMAAALTTRAACRRRLLQLDDALEDATRALDLLDGLDEHELRASAHNTVGETHYHRGEHDAATGSFSAGLEQLPADAEPTTIRLQLLNNIGRVHFELCEYAHAIRHFVRVLELSRATDDRRLEGISHVNIGNVLSQVGDFEGSLAAYRDALAIQRAEGHRAGEALSLANLAEVSHRIGDDDEALRLGRQSLALAPGHDPESFAPRTILLLSRLLMRAERFEEADDEALRALDLEEQRTNLAGQAHALTVRGEICSRRGDDESAMAHLRHSLELLSRVQSPLDELETRLAIARLQLANPAHGDALETLRSLREELEHEGDRVILADVLRLLADAFEQRGDLSRALSLHKVLRTLEHDLFRQDVANRTATLQVTHQLEAERHRADVLAGTRSELERRMDRRTRELNEAHRELQAALEDRMYIQEQRATLEEQLNHAQKMESIGRLAGGLAHDFNNLLTVIIGSTEVLFEDSRNFTTRQQDAAQNVLAAAVRAAELTSQLLTLSRKRAIHPGAVDVNSVLDEMTRMLRHVVGEAVVLDVTAATDAQPVACDAGQLQQIVLNLVVNACDAMPDGGSLTLSTRPVRADGTGDLPTGDYTALQVTDTGTGIDSETRRLIFDPFFTTKADGKGTGLGLSVVHGIVRQCGGDVRVTSEPDQGARFEVILPVTDALVETQDASEVPAPNTLEGPFTVLLVEDDGRVRELMRTVLVEHDFRVLEAADGRQALEVATASDTAIDLVVSDVVMPHLGGPDLMKRMQHLRPGIRFLFTSGYPDHTDRLPPELHSQSSFLPKPFRMHTLVEQVTELIRGS